MSRTIVVIPCFNEAARLDVAAYSSFLGTDADVSLLFVDDGSTDGTRALLAEFCGGHAGQARSMTLGRNSGKAEAVRQGILSAIDENPQYVGFWDADLATPLEDVKAFQTLMDDRSGIHAVFGSRVNLLGRSVRRNLLRHYVGRLFATTAAAVLRMGVYDTQCGAKMFRVSSAMGRVFAEPFISPWIFDIEIIARMQEHFGRDGLPRARDCIFEYPLMIWRDVAGSKIRLKHFITVAIDLVRIRFRYSPKG